MRASSSGAPEGKFASTPFGDSQSTLSGADTDAYHYAGLDYDSETSTDHAQFRQYSPVQGNWLSPDPYAGSYDLSDPQSLNRYAYVLNNPVAASDVSGLMMCAGGSCLGDGGGESFNAPGGDGGWGTWGDWSGWSGESSLEETTINIYFAGAPIGSDSGDNEFSNWSFSSYAFPSGSSAGAPANAPNNGTWQKTQSCVSSFYNSGLGKAVQFGSPLSLLPGWNPGWGNNLKEWGVAIVGKLGGLVGSGAVPGTTQITTLSGTQTIGSGVELNSPRREHSQWLKRWRLLRCWRQRLLILQPTVLVQ
jgi:RHS repeat-associated protein